MSFPSSVAFPSKVVAAARRPGVPLVLAVVLTALLASGVAWSATGKTAVLSVDGTPTEVDFRGGTVEDVLAAAGIEVGERDLLVPARGTEVGDGDTVAIRRARQITLVVDGVEREVWVTATSVDEALDQIGLRDGALALSASRSRDLPLDGFRLAVTTPKDISILADNAVTPLSTTAPTVRDALIEAGIVLDADDRISDTRTTPLTDRMVIRVTRVSTTRTTEDVAVPFETERREDGDLFKGETRTLRAGKAGLVRRTVETVVADGAVEKRTVLSTTTVRAPVARILAVGTKARPAPAPAQSSASRSAGGNADSLNWPALARCESGGNPRAVSSTGKYRGLYQFSMTTWRSVGGQGDPIDNSAGEQTYRAKVLYNKAGAGQWPHCGKYLFT
jgi:uncharacterized protein YabE (DUF348 family)